MKAEAAALAASQADDAMMPSPFAAAFDEAMMPSLSSGLDDDVRVPVLGLV